MISIEIRGLQSVRFLTEIFSSSTKVKSIITTVLQLTKNYFRERFKELRIPSTK